MTLHRIGRSAIPFVWIFLGFFAGAVPALAEPPRLAGWEAPSGVFACPSGGGCAEQFPGLASPIEQKLMQPLPPLDGPAVESYPVQSAGYLNEMAELDHGSLRKKDFFSLGELCEEIKRRDAAASSSADYGRGMTLVLDDKGKKYIRFLTWAQVWTTFTDNNPGTVFAQTNPLGSPEPFTEELKDSALDIGLRRIRFLTYSQLTERYLILLHVGINNQTFTTGGGSGTLGVGPNVSEREAPIGAYGRGKKPQVFVHDVWNEYAVLPESECSDVSLAVGAGLHYWNGVSRKSSSSTMGYMTVDAPIFTWPNIEFTDQFARQLGWYAKGKLHKLDYRVAINHPFNADAGAALNTERAVNVASHSLAFAGYFDWQFWDQESNLLPYRTSTWLGQKSVFNLGAGFYLHPDASGILDADGQLQKQDQLALGFDCYLDKPVGDCGAAVTLYGVYYVYDYGDNYYRDIGIMNTGRLGTPGFLAAEGITPTISGAGNAQPLMGTGEILYLEGGYLLPSWVLGESRGRLQPFGAFTHKNLAWLDDPAFNWDMGVNYLIDGHRAKLTFQYSLRPKFLAQTEEDVVHRVSDGSAGQFIIQAQVAL